MARIVKPLRFERGYTPDPAPHRTNGGMPDCQNVVLLPERTGFKAIDGATRVTPANLDVGSGEATSTFDVIKFNPSVLGVTRGVGLAIVKADASGNGAVVGFTVNLADQSVNYTGGITDIGTFDASGGTSTMYPALVNYQGNTFIQNGYTYPLVFDGKQVRDAGISGPKNRIWISSAGTTNSIHGLTDVGGWTTGAGATVTVSYDVNNPNMDAAIASFYSTKIVWNSATMLTGGQTFITKTTGMGTFDVADTRIGFWILSSKELAPNTLQWVLKVGGSNKTTVVTTPILRDVWQWVEEDYAGGAGAISEGSLGLVAPATTDLQPLTLYVSGLKRITPTAGLCGLSSGASVPTFYQAVTTFFDPSNVTVGAIEGRESNPGPMSAPFKPVATGGVLKINAFQYDVDDAGAQISGLQQRFYLRNVTAGDDFHLVAQKTPATSATASMDDSTLNLQPFLTEFVNNSLPACRYGIVHGNRIVWAGMARAGTTIPSFSSGVIDVTNGSSRASFYSGGSNYNYAWLRGLQVRVGTDSTIYTIYRRLYSATDGASVLIGTAFDTDTGVVPQRATYQGSTNSSASFAVSGEQNGFFFTNMVRSEGTLVAYAEGWNALNFVPVRQNDGDEVTGIGIVNGDLLFLKRKSSWIATQNYNNADNDDAPAFNVAELLSDNVGLVAPRSLTALPDGTMAGIAGNRRIAIWSNDRVSFLPGSDFLKNYFSQFTSSQIEATIGGYHAGNRWLCFYTGTKMLIYDFVNQVYAVAYPKFTITCMTSIRDDNGQDNLYAGDSKGYIYKLFDSSAQNWGGQCGTTTNVFQFTAISGTSSTVSIADTIQPNATAGKDTKLQEGNPTTNYATDTTCAINATGSSQRMVIEFDLSSYLHADSLASAVVTFTGSCATGGTLFLRRVTQSGWTEAGATWNKYDGTNDWATAGGDYSTTNQGSAPFLNTDTSFAITITDLAKDAIANRSGRLILLLMLDGVGSFTINTSDHGTAGNRPKITLSANSDTLLATDDGLKYLYLIKESRNYRSIETHQIASNTTSAITISDTWTTNPVDGDRLIIGGMEAYADFMEYRFGDTVSPQGVNFDMKYTSGAPFDVSVFTGSGSNRAISTSAAAEQVFAIAKGSGSILPDVEDVEIGTKGQDTFALRFRLHWIPRSPSHVLECYQADATIQARDTGRGQSAE